MDSKKKLKHIFEYLLDLEEKTKALYDSGIVKLSDRHVIHILTEVRDEEKKHIQIAEKLLGILKKYDGKETNKKNSVKSTFQVWSYLIAGVFLGLGAPVGGIALRYFLDHPHEINQWLGAEWVQNGWFYLYMAIGTVLAFLTAAGVVAEIHKRLNLRAQNLGMQARILEKRSVKDGLTGLFNFGYICERLAIEMERAKRFQTPLACLMLDIDNLKEVNDKYGHLAGDDLLRGVARVIEKEIRLIDTATRYGGDEFLIILPVTPVKGGSVVAARIRKKIEETQFQSDKITIKTSVSIGIASYPSDEISDIDSLVGAADKALYEAKRAGRNRERAYG